MIALKYVQRQPDPRGGPARHYFRFRDAPSIRILGTEGSPEYLAHYRELLKAAQAGKAIAPVKRIEHPQLDRQPARVGFLPGSVGWLIEQYFGSADYRDLKSGTQDLYRRMLDVLKKEIGAGMIADLKRSHVTHICAKIAQDRTAARAHLALRLLSVLWKFALRLPMARIDENAHNPTRDVQSHYTVKQPHAPWPETVQKRFLDGAPTHLRLAFALLLYTGQRRSDVIKMQWADYDGRTIHVVQEKTGEVVPLHVHRELAEILDATPRIHAQILTSGHRRRPYVPEALTHAFANRLKAVGLPPGKYTLHGLRKTAGVKLAEAGCTEVEIMRVLGHASPKMAHYYIREANKQRLVAGAIGKWERAVA